MVILLLRNQQFHADPDGIGSQTIQHTDICTAAAASQFLICDFPEIITGNNGIDSASCERIGVRTVQDICDTGLCFGTFDLQPAITELHDFHKGILLVDRYDLCMRRHNFQWHHAVC